MRIILINILLILSSFVFSQELSFGGFAATNWITENRSEILAFGANVEYKPAKSVASVNSDVTIFYVRNSSVITVPLYLKIVIGNEFRVCPTFGVFVRTNKNYGYVAGLSIDYKVKKRLSLFLKADYMRDYWEDDRSYYANGYNKTTTYVGGKRINSTGGYSIWFSFGFKVNILKPNRRY